MKKDRMHKARIARLNPLADYKKQVKNNRKPVKSRYGDTSLSEDARNELWKMDDDTRVDFWLEMGNFPYFKIMLSASNRDLIFSLKPSSLSLFIFIAFNLDFRADEIKIDFKQCKKQKLNISKGSFIKSIEELESKKVIERIGTKRTPDYWKFFINPQIFFLGDAKKFYKDVLQEHPDYAIASALK